MGTDGLIIVKLLATIATFLTIALARDARRKTGRDCGMPRRVGDYPDCHHRTTAALDSLFLAVLCRILTAAPR
jgi:hypothetical protein